MVMIMKDTKLGVCREVRVNLRAVQDKMSSEYDQNIFYGNFRELIPRKIYKEKEVGPGWKKFAHWGFVINVYHHVSHYPFHE